MVDMRNDVKKYINKGKIEESQHVQKYNNFIN